MKSDIRELARELAGEACREVWGFAIDSKAEAIAKRFEPIIAKQFAEPQPVAMEAVVERIAEHATKTAEALNRGYYMPSMTECLAPLIRAELAPVETLLRECHSELNIARARLDTQHQCQVSQDTVCWQWEHHRLKAWSKLISQLDTTIGGTHGTGK